MTVIKPQKIQRSKEYYLRLIRNKKMDLEIIPDDKKTKSDITRLEGKLNIFIKEKK